jgi:OTU domain-containing protein 3
MEETGSYADNGCLVAFSRLYQLDIVIHQLGIPIWTIAGSDNKNIKKQLHLAYHNGEHYSSLRPIGDRSNEPTNIKLNSKDNNESGKYQKKSINICCKI